MTNLTDKWKKGELKEGLYWVKHDGIINILDNLEIALTNVDEVLAEVPSYDEYQKLLSDQLAKNEGVEINAELEAENTKLKELLKECQDEIEYLRKHYKGNIDHFKNNTRLDKEIKQVLGEE